MLQNQHHIVNRILDFARLMVPFEKQLPVPVRCVSRTRQCSFSVRAGDKLPDPGINRHTSGASAHDTGKVRFRLCLALCQHLQRYLVKAVRVFAHCLI